MPLGNVKQFDETREPYVGAFNERPTYSTAVINENFFIMRLASGC